MFTLNGYCLPIRDMTEVIKGKVRRISTRLMEYQCLVEIDALFLFWSYFE